ncbi:MAG: hypothetical protein ACM3O3_08300 [Syntrophothermus sp.]
MKNFIWILILFSFIVSSCCSQEISSNKTKLKYSIIAGEGGGVTGRHSGVFIDTSSAVYSFEGKSFDTAKKDSVMMLDNAKIEKLNSIIDSLMNYDLRESGNIYKYIILENSKSEKRLSWIPGSSNASKLDTYYNYIFEIAKFNK